jgi:ArsR family transcriptional regulator
MSMKTIAIVQVCCVPGAPPLPVRDREQLALRFKALADPARIHIINRVAAHDEVCVCDLQAELDLSQPTISYHLKVLREAGLIEGRRDGTWSFYRLREGAIDELAAALGR